MLYFYERINDDDDDDDEDDDDDDDHDHDDERESRRSKSVQHSERGGISDEQLIKHAA